MAKARNLADKLKNLAPELLPNLDWLPTLTGMDVTKLAATMGEAIRSITRHR